MDSEVGQLGFDTRSHSSPPYLQHQFFPGGGGIQPMHPNHAEHTNGRWSSSSNGDGSAMRGAEYQPHWDMKAWKWDNVMFVAQPVAGPSGGSALEGAGREACNEDRACHKVSEIAFRHDGVSGTEQQINHNEDEESELRSRSFFGRETPSPPLNERASFPRDEDSPEEVGSLSLKLGGESYSYAEENGNSFRNGKRGRSSSPQSQIPMCQVDECRADLSKAKDYHRRHKVCEMHSKAAKALVSRLMQRFCQQCSRFHPLQEFDEGKRSCRRRLAGHNRRRRKTQPDAAAARAYLMAEEDRLGKGGAGLIGGLLSILSQLTASASLERLDREALLRKAVSASLEDLNRTALSWNQVLPNTDRAAASLGQRLDQVTASSGRATDLVMETQHLLARLAGPSPEALSHLLQSGLKAQIAEAVRSGQDNPLLHMQGGGGPGPVVQAASCRIDARGTEAGPSQSYDPTAAGVAHSLLSPHPGRVSMNPEIVRPTATAPIAFPQHTSEHSAGQCDQFATGYPGFAPNVQRLFPQHAAAVNQIPTNLQVVNGPVADAGGTPSIDGRKRPMLPFLGNHDRRSSFKAVSPSARSAADLQQLPCHEVSDNSQSGSDEQSPTSSIEPWRNRTRRISFKLFERTPEELPSNLRLQIDTWLANLPSDMESYIRPGCVVLTIFVSMPNPDWMELDMDLQGSLKKFLSVCGDDFWCKGRILVQVERQTVLIVDGEIQENEYLEAFRCPHIQSVRPLAFEAGQHTTITCKGLNLTLSGTKLLCAYRGRNLLQETFEGDCAEGEDTSCDSEQESDEDMSDDHSNDGSTTLAVNDEAKLFIDNTFTLCGIPSNAVGRCFIEAEHQITAGNTRPVIVADKLVCKELRELEDEIEAASLHAAQAALEEGLEPLEVFGCSEVARMVVEEDMACFLHELGWFFQSSSYWHLKNPTMLDTIPAIRLKCLLVFSVERGWCAVVRKLLDIVVGHENIETAVAALSHLLQDEVSLLHRAVRKKCRPMVELLLAYVPSCFQGDGKLSMENFHHVMQFKLQWGRIFRPDMAGPAGLTPLHIAASMQDAEDVVDALTNDPCQVGLNAWANKTDDSGQTPLSCALGGGNIKSIYLVRVKLLRLETSGDVSISMPTESLPQAWNPRSGVNVMTGSPAALELAVWVDRGKEKVEAGKASQPSCRVRSFHASPYGGIKGPAFRPFLLSLVAIAAVCVCVCLVFKGPPQVRFVLSPFRWEGLGSGPA